MRNIPLLTFILFGDFGLLTAVPRYLFLVLFPVMVLVDIFGQVFARLPILGRPSPFANQCFYCVIGLGCTTAALASLACIEDKKRCTAAVL